MIEVTLRELNDSIESLKDLVKKPLKVKTAYHLARLVREVEKEVNLYEEKRNELVKKYAERDENGELKLNENNQWTVDKSNIEAFVKELSELLDSSVEINVEKIKLDDLNCEVNAEQMINLMVFVEE